MLFDFESHTSQPYIKSIDFLRDEGENKQTMLIFVSGCSTPLISSVHVSIMLIFSKYAKNLSISLEKSTEI